MAYLFRLILLCIPLFGAVAATAEAQRIDRAVVAHATATEAQDSEAEMVLALNTVAPILNTTSSSESVATGELAVSQEMVTGAGAGLPMCLALVLLVTLVRKRAY